MASLPPELLSAILRPQEVEFRTDFDSVNVLLHAVMGRRRYAGTAREANVMPDEGGGG